MKKISFIIFILLILYHYAFGQIERKQVKYFARDQFIFDFNYNYWLDKENKSKQKWNSFGYEFSVMYNLIGKNSNVCIAGGFGLSFENKNLETIPKDSATNTYFLAIPSNIDYRKNKINLTYINIPLEIRIRTNPNEKRKSLKIYLGGQFSYLLSNHNKYIGEDLNTTSWIKVKHYNLPNISPFRYGVTLRIGFGKLNLKGYYALNTLFEESKAPEIYPINIGVSLFLF